MIVKSIMMMIFLEQFCYGSLRNILDKLENHALKWDQDILNFQHEIIECNDVIPNSIGRSQGCGFESESDLKLWWGDLKKSLSINLAENEKKMLTDKETLIICRQTIYCIWTWRCRSKNITLFSFISNCKRYINRVTYIILYISKR